MPALPSHVLLAYLERAAEEPLGLYLRTNNVHLLKTDFYRAMSEAHLTTEDLGIMICVPALDNTLFIVRRSLELDPP